MLLREIQIKLKLLLIDGNLHVQCQAWVLTGIFLKSKIPEKKNKLSNEDKKSWDEFLKNPNNILDKETKKINKKKPTRYKFDLHGISIDEANKKVTEIIENCYDEGFSEILLITGKGQHSKSGDNVYVSRNFSTLKGTIPEFIKNNTSLSTKIYKMQTAPENEGGEGALIIKLKNPLKNKFWQISIFN